MMMNYDIEKISRKRIRGWLARNFLRSENRLMQNYQYILL